MTNVEKRLNRISNIKDKLKNGEHILFTVKYRVSAVGKTCGQSICSLYALGHKVSDRVGGGNELVSGCFCDFINIALQQEMLIYNKNHSSSDFINVHYKDITIIDNGLNFLCDKLPKLGYCLKDIGRNNYVMYKVDKN